MVLQRPASTACRRLVHTCPWVLSNRHCAGDILKNTRDILKNMSNQLSTKLPTGAEMPLMAFGTLMESLDVSTA